MPRGVDELEAVRIFFKEKRICEASGFEIPGDLRDEEEERGAHVRKAGLAIKRLRDKFGSAWVPSKRPSSAQDLRLLRETAVDRIIRGKDRVEREDLGRVVCDSGMARRKESAEDGGKVAKPLQASDVPGAVTSDVAARLHARAGEMVFSRGEDVGSGIRWAPASLRDDLARAVGSNAKVNASGESGRDRTTLPVVVKSMCDALVDQVHSAVMALAARGRIGYAVFVAGDCAEVSVGCGTG